MEPSFWSWEKRPAAGEEARHECPRNGAQLLELGKGGTRRPG